MFAKNKSEVSQKPIDYFSIGHVIMGMLTFIVCRYISFSIVPHGAVANWNASIMTIIVSWFWELIENAVLVRTRLKYGNDQDSALNVLMDQLFVAFGILIQLFLFLTDNIHIVFYGTIVILNFLMWFYFIWRKKTHGSN